MLFNQLPIKEMLFFFLYGGTAFTALIASIYLFFRKNNAFSSDITPPVSLRRWAAAFLAVGFLSHVWWYLFCIYSNDIHSVSYLVVVTIYGILLMTPLIGTLLAMLQDRQRRVWPIITAIIPFYALLAFDVAYPDGYFLYVAIAYFLLYFVALIIYMVCAVRQYRRWLRDNYADLEHKEVWKSYVLIIFVLLLMIIDGINFGDIVSSYIEHFIALALFGFILWRVETLPLLENALTEQTDEALASETPQEDGLLMQAQQTSSPSTNIEQLLAEHCVATNLYLQHDLTLLQLSQAVGTNRYYLSQYFSSQGITYNAYINDLRINHFIDLYREAVAAQQPIVAQQLASDSGYRSYSTFSLAFKQRMGQSVTAWMRETAAT